MDREGGARGGFCYYKVLLILDDASPFEIRSAYLKLALVNPRI
jgi:DnaJ-class molecular chaperone